VVGSIEPGKLADVVVIDRDLLTCPESEIKDIEPLLVIVDGKISASSGRCAALVSARP
jgi:predicted amidohydrolase YtcJ